MLIFIGEHMGVYVKMYEIIHLKYIYGLLW